MYFFSLKNLYNFCQLSEFKSSVTPSIEKKSIVYVLPPLVYVLISTNKLFFWTSTDAITINARPPVSNNICSLSIYPFGYLRLWIIALSYEIDSPFSSNGKPCFVFLNSLYLLLLFGLSFSRSQHKAQSSTIFSQEYTPGGEYNAFNQKEA